MKKRLEFLYHVVKEERIVSFNMCQECYSNDSRATPKLHPRECLENHKQYICGTCGRCICIECDKKRNVQRWNFPFKTLEMAKLYLRTADYTMKKACIIYKIKNNKGRISFKIFADDLDIEKYLKRNQDKIIEPVFSVGEYKEYPDTKVKKLTLDEIEQYLIEYKNH